MIELSRSLCFFDIETTGLDIGKDKIIELSIIKLMPDGSKEEYYSKFHPGSVEISEGAQEKHGINIEDLRNEPSFTEKAEEIFDFISNCDLGGYNAAKFDIPFLVEEFMACGKAYNPRSSSVIDPLAILRTMEPRTLEGAYKYYTGKNLTDAHSARADIMATVEIFEAQMLKYTDLSDLSIEEISEKTLGRNNNVDLAGKFRKNDDGNIIITFGKHRNKTVGQIFNEDARYFEWMQAADGFTKDTKIIAKKILEKLKQQ